MFYKSMDMKSYSASLELRHLQQVVPVEKLAVLLPKDIHRYTQHTDCDLNAAEYDEEVVDADRKHPIIGVIGENKAEDVLEDDEVRERFHCNVAMGVKQVLRRCYRAHDHTDDDECEKDLGDNPAVSCNVVRRDTKAVEADA